MKKFNIPMYAACVLLCLVLISTYMTSGLYARYTAQGEMYDDARVAKFEVTEGYTKFSEELKLDIAPGETYKAAVSVTNNSEVAINYVIDINNITGNLPLKFKYRSGGGEYKELPHSGENLAPNGTTAKYDIQIQFDDEKAIDYMGMVDYITIELRAEQID